MSLWRTLRAIRRANGFTSYPMVEVFLIRMPALELLRTRGSDLGVQEP